MKTITVEQLEDADACESQVELFREKFGGFVELTEELCVQHAQEFDFGWAACYLELSCDQFDAFEDLNNQARKVWLEALAPSKAAFDADCRRARHDVETFFAVRGQIARGFWLSTADLADKDSVEARRKFTNAIRQAERDLELASAPHQEEYKRAVARAFFRAYTMESGE